MVSAIGAFASSSVVVSGLSCICSVRPARCAAEDDEERKRRDEEVHFILLPNSDLFADNGIV